MARSGGESLSVGSLDTSRDDELAGAEARAEAAEERLRSLALVRAAAEHRMKTTLAVIGGWARTLDERWEELDDRQRRAGIAIVRRASDELADQTERMLEESRAELLGPDQEPVRLDLAAVLEMTTTAFAGMGEHVLEARVASRPLEVMADPAALHQVLGHLIENAVKYSPAGSRVLLRACRGSDAAVIQVIDQGCGIPEDVELFVPFQRGPDTDGVAGVGLGLFIVRNLVQGMGGEITAARNAGAGSTFTVRLPLAG